MKFGLEGTKTSKTPIATTTKLNKDEQGKSIDINLYCSMIGCLLYLMASKSDIMFSVCVCVILTASRPDIIKCLFVLDSNLVLKNLI